MSITEGDVRHVAALARLAIDEGRMPSLVAELNGILSHMEVLQGVTLPADAHGMMNPEGMRLRPDAPGAVSNGGDLAAFAPNVRDGFFLVPRLVTHATAGAPAGAAPPLDVEDES